MNGSTNRADSAFIVFLYVQNAQLYIEKHGKMQSNFKTYCKQIIKKV